ncbi:MAG: lamin tail domain-containing protein [Bacteroidota bacterium]|nr:lamin tail domain-containing protein [Bacteroidota bacterium]
MAKQFLFMLWVLLPLPTLAQWTDSFSDGNFTKTPRWSGDSAKFVVNTANQLQLKAPAQTGSASLYTASNIAIKASWSFLVKMEFNPSSSNYAKIFLMSTQTDLNAPLDGYFLRIGGANDDLCLFRQQGDNETLIADGRDKMFNTSAVNARIKVTRDDKGNWALFCDTTGGLNYKPVVQCLDFTVKNSSFFGIQCVYSSTRSTKFYFDDFVVSGESYTDGVKPSIESFNILDNKRLGVVFSEPVNKASALNFSLANNSISEITCNESGKEAALTFVNSFSCEQDNKLKITNISDLSGLKMNDTVLNFKYCTTQLFDVVFNEVMADPSPSAGLPEVEYLELYNRSHKTFNLSGWELTVGLSNFTLPSIMLYPDSFLIVTSKTDAPRFTAFGNTVGLFTSSSALNNTGQYLRLKNREGNIVANLSYDSSWYGDDFKAQGGWALEQIDPFNPCGGKGNWKASQAKTGGTPGRKNSVFMSNPDVTQPEIFRIHVPSDSIINLWFTEPVDSVLGTSVLSYNIAPAVGSSREVRVMDNSFTSVQLLLSQKIKPNTSYSITVSGNITDCAGNKLPEEVAIPFQLPSYPETNSIVINEVLFNAQSGGADYIELYNRSGKTLDARRLLVGVETNGKMTSLCRLSENGFLIQPAAYLLLSSDPDKVKPFYKVVSDKNFVVLPCMPSLDDKSSTIVLQNDTFGEIDKFQYSEKMHLPTLKSLEGISLERVNPDKPTNFPGNWHSAAETSGYGTPGYKNSQYLADSVSKALIQLKTDIFSPDNDGNDDMLQVSYQFDKPGLRTQVIVFDASGRIVKRLLNNELLGTSGSFTWDGRNDAGRISPVGMYVLFIRVVSDDGVVNEFKKPCVLAIKR